MPQFLVFHQNFLEGCDGVVSEDIVDDVHIFEGFIGVIHLKEGVE